MQIFPNGYMKYRLADRGNDLDDNGYAVSDTGFSGECRCTITVITDNRKGRYDDGQYRNASYSITCNMEDVSDTFNPTAVSLTHDNKGNLGVFQVQRVEYYNLTGTIEVWV